MSRALKPATPDQQVHAENALDCLRKARAWMRYAETPKTMARLEATIKSAEGSIRHIERRVVATAALRSELLQRGAT
jgi:hypothetical protein